MKTRIKDHPATGSYLDRAKYEVSRNLFSFLAIILGSVGILNMIQGDINMIPLLVGSGICVLILWILIRWRNYRISAFIGMFMAFGLTVYNMSITSNFGHFVDFFWIVCIAIYLFFLLGNRWGVINLFMNMAAVVVMLHLDRTGVIEQVDKPYTQFSAVNFALNVLISGIVFSYITIKVLRALQKSDQGMLHANSELKQSNEEKTMMLKEIHHRVKNNLQVITSLLRLQLYEIEDETAKHHFEDSINRVAAMAIIHEKMYQSQSLSRIDLESYVVDLVDALIASYAVNLDIETHIKSNIKNMEPESIVPLALIFNELVSNSLEHAFQNESKGQLNIDIQQSSEEHTTIHYSDNGVWRAPQKEYSFGLELISSFTEQLDGTFRRDIRPNGTHYHFEFKRQL